MIILLIFSQITRGQRETPPLTFSNCSKFYPCIHRSFEHFYIGIYAFEAANSKQKHVLPYCIVYDCIAIYGVLYRSPSPAPFAFSPPHAGSNNFFAIRSEKLWYRRFLLWDIEMGLAGSGFRLIGSTGSTGSTRTVFPVSLHQTFDT